MDDHAELVKLKVIFEQRQASIKSSFELLSSFYDWLNRENQLNVQLQAENTALRSELQLPRIQFVPIDALQADDISDMLKAIRAMLHGSPLAGGCRFDAEFQGPAFWRHAARAGPELLQISDHAAEVPSHRSVPQGDDEDYAKDPYAASSTETRAHQAFSVLGGPEDTCQITGRHGSSTSGHQDPWHQENEGMHVQQGHHATRSAQTAWQQTVSAQFAQPQLRRADRPRRLEPGTTTLMIRNVPARYDQPRLIQEWPPNGAYDFLYLPSTRKGFSRGYVFLNFVSPEHALLFQQQWHGGRLSSHGTTKHLDISAARAQGIAANLKDILGGADWNTWIQHASTVPLIFNGTQSIDVESVVLRLGLNAHQ